ncbi:MAG: extracellular solute-binding protein, partial [Anaerolineae bacterium]|nr:extracellular solute-binding protein [Anaerolineae bacterium]
MRLRGLIGVACLLLLALPLRAQEEIILTIAMQEWRQDALSEEILRQFQDENPGIKVVRSYYKSGDEAFWGIEFSDIEASLDKAAEYVSTGDVLLLTGFEIGSEMTRAGLLLDLNPLLNADPAAGLEDFDEDILRSYRWDGGTWALPLTASVNMFIYDKTAFDAAGLAYPDEAWSLEDLLTTAEVLTVRNAEGEATLPGMFGFDRRALVYALLGRGLYDPMALPEVPVFDDPELLAVMERLLAYEADLALNETAMGNLEWDRIPLTLQTTWRLGSFGGMPGDDREWGGSLLPGGAVMITAEAAAINSATPHPEAAYKLVQFLTRSPEVINRMFGDRPARTSLLGADPGENGYMRPELPPEVQDLIDRGLQNAITRADMRYMDYLWLVGRDEDGEPVADVAQSLRDLQQQARDNLAAAEARRGQLSVAAPVVLPTPSLLTDEIALDFLMVTNIMPMPNREQWQRLIEDFVLNDPRVGLVNLKSDFSLQVTDVDCAYMPYNMVPGGDLSTLLPLDPLLNSDPNFDPQDIPGGLLAQVQRDGQTWGLPIQMEPGVIWYHAERFAAAGAPEPFTGWNASDLEAALRALKTAEPDVEPFVSASFGNIHLLLLAVAYGGLPVDYATDPPTYALTDAANVAALRQVLNLAKDGLLEYQSLERFSGDMGISEPALYESFLTLNDWRLQSNATPYKPVLFPRSSAAQPFA